MKTEKTERRHKETRERERQKQEKEKERRETETDGETEKESDEGDVGGLGEGTWKPEKLERRSERGKNSY